MANCATSRIAVRYYKMQSQRVTRRGLLQGAAGLAFFRGAHAMSQPSSYFAYVGCRTTRERNARGEGINVYRVVSDTGRWNHIQLIKGLANPSFLAFDRGRRCLYAVHGDLTDI